MKSFIILSLLLLSQTYALNYQDSCGTEYKDNANYLKICTGDNDDAGTNSWMYVKFYYSSTDGNLYTSEKLTLDNLYCDDFYVEVCDYFDVVPSDLGVIHNIQIELDGSDGIQIGAIELKYGDYIANFDGSDQNDCVSTQNWGTDYPEFITLDFGDICQAVVIEFSDPNAENAQTAELVAANNGSGGDECICDLSDYAVSQQSGLCDSCYFVCNEDEDCTVETENCGSILKYTDNYMEICTSWGFMADSDTDFQVRWNYQDNDGVSQQTEWAEGDNMECDDFILGKCDFFDDVPTDMASINYMDIQKRGSDGWQMNAIEIFSQGVQLGAFGGYDAQNECITVLSEYYYGNNDASMIWTDEDDICQTIRMHFVDGQVPAIYAIEVCNCDIALESFSVGITSGDYESCAAICYPNEFEAMQEKSCDVVTIYEECDYGGQSMEVQDSVDCLEWQPKSICVPDGMEVTIYDLCWYKEPINTFTDNESCMSDTGLLLLEQNGSKKLNTKDLHAKVEVNY